MAQPAPWRLNLLRCGYLLLVVGLGLTIWPQVVQHHEPSTVSAGVVRAMLAALSASAILGLRYPLKMLPLLVFELAWKSIWLLAVALPQWRAHHLDAAEMETVYECAMAVIFLPLIPWDHVAATYFGARAEPWRLRSRREEQPA
jgi:hypothetical protein